MHDLCLPGAERSPPHWSLTHCRKHAPAVAEEKVGERLCQPKCVGDSPTTSLLKQMSKSVNLRGGTNSVVLVILAMDYSSITDKTYNRDHP